MIKNMRHTRLFKLIAIRVAWALFVTTTLQGISYADISGNATHQNLNLNSRLGDTITSSDNSHVPGDLGPDDLRQAAEVLGHAEAFDETRAAKLEGNRKTQIAADGVQEGWRAERARAVQAAESWWQHRSAPRSFDDPIMAEALEFLTEMNPELQRTLANWDRVAYDEKGFVARIDFPYPGVAGLANTLGALCLLGRFGDELNISLAEGTFTTPVYMPFAQRSIQRDMGHEWVVLGRESGLYYFSLTDGLFALNRDPDLSVAVMAFKMSNMAGVIPDSERGPMSHRPSYERTVLSGYHGRYDDFVLCPLIQTQEMLDGASGPIDEQADLRIVGQLVEASTPGVVRWMLRGLVRLGGTTAPMYREALPNPLRETLGYVFHRGIHPDQAPEAADELERHIRQAISEGREAEMAQVVCDIARRWSGHGRVEGPVAELLAQAGRIARGDSTDTDDTSLPAGSPHEVLSGLAGQLGDRGFTRDEIAEDLLGGGVASSTIRSDLTFLGPQHCRVLQRRRAGRRTEWSVSPEARPHMDEILDVLRPLRAMRPDTDEHRSAMAEAEERIVRLLEGGTGTVVDLSDVELVREINDEWPLRVYCVVADAAFDLLTLESERGSVEEVAVPNIDHPGYGRLMRRVRGNLGRAVMLDLPGVEELMIALSEGNAVFLKASGMADPEASYPEIGTPSETTTWGNTAEEVVFSAMWHASMHLAFCHRLTEEDMDRVAEAVGSTENERVALTRRLIQEEDGYDEQDPEENRELAEETFCYLLTTLREERLVRSTIDDVLAETGLASIVEECWQDSRPSDGPEGAVVAEVRRQAGELHAYTGQPSYLDRIATAAADSAASPGAEDATYEYSGEPGEIRVALGAVEGMIQAGRFTPVPIARHIRNRFERVWQQVIAPEVMGNVQLVQIPDEEMDSLGLDGPAYGFGNYMVMRQSVFREDQALIDQGRLTEFGRTFIHEITARHLGTRQAMARGQGDVHHWAARNVEQQLETAVLLEHRSRLEDRLQEMTGPRKVFTSGPDARCPVRIEIAKHAFENGLTEKVAQRLVDAASWTKVGGLQVVGRSLIVPLEEDEFLHCQGRTFRAIYLKSDADLATKGPPRMKPYVVPSDQRILQPSRSFEMDKGGKIRCKKVPAHPTGTGFTYEADNEDAMTAEAFWGGFPTGYSIGTGQLVTMSFEDKPVGFVMIAKENVQEPRFGEVIHYKSEKAAAASGTAAKRSGLREAITELARGTRQGAGELRNLHEMGITHTHPHHGQWVIYGDGRLVFYDFPNARSVRTMSRDEFIFRTLNDFRSMYFNTYVLASGDGTYRYAGRFGDMMRGIGVSSSPLEEQTNGYFTGEDRASVGESRLRRATDPANATPFLIRYFAARTSGAPMALEGMTMQELARENDLARIFVEVGGRLYDRLMASPPTAPIHEVPVAGNVEVANMRLELASLNHEIETRSAEHQAELERIEVAMQADRDRGFMPLREDIAMDGGRAGRRAAVSEKRSRMESLLADRARLEEWLGSLRQLPREPAAAPADGRVDLGSLATPGWLGPLNNRLEEMNGGRPLATIHVNGTVRFRDDGVIAQVASDCRQQLDAIRDLDPDDLVYATVTDAHKDRDRTRYRVVVAKKSALEEAVRSEGGDRLQTSCEIDFLLDVHGGDGSILFLKDFVASSEGRGTLALDAMAAHRGLTGKGLVSPSYKHFVNFAIQNFSGYDVKALMGHPASLHLFGSHFPGAQPVSGRRTTPSYANPQAWDARVPDMETATAFVKQELARVRTEIEHQEFIEACIAEAGQPAARGTLPGGEAINRLVERLGSLTPEARHERVKEISSRLKGATNRRFLMEAWRWNDWAAEPDTSIEGVKKIWDFVAGENNSTLQETMAHVRAQALPAEEAETGATHLWQYPGTCELGASLLGLCLAAQFPGEVKITRMGGMMYASPASEDRNQTGHMHQWLVVEIDGRQYYLSATDGFFGWIGDAAQKAAYKDARTAANFEQFQDEFLSEFGDRGFTRPVLLPWDKVKHFFKVEQRWDWAEGDASPDSMLAAGLTWPHATPDLIELSLRGVAEVCAPHLSIPLQFIMVQALVEDGELTMDVEVFQALSEHVAQLIREGEFQEAAQIISYVARAWHGQEKPQATELIARAVKGEFSTGDRDALAGSYHGVFAEAVGRVLQGPFTRPEMAGFLGVSSNTIRADLTFLGPEHCGLLRLDRVGNRYQWSLTPEALDHTGEIFEILEPLGAMRRDTDEHKRRLDEAEARIVRLLRGERITASESTEGENRQDDAEDSQKERSEEARQQPEKAPAAEAGELSLTVLKNAGLAATRDEKSGSLVVGMDIGLDSEGRHVLAQVPIYAPGGLMAPWTERAAWQEQIGQISTGFDETRRAAQRVGEARRGFQGNTEAREQEMMKSSQVEGASLAIAMTHNNGTLAQMRAAGGYDELREQIHQAVLEHTSFEEGFRMFRREIKRAYNRDVHNMEELNRILPDVTSYEVTMCSMLQRLPAAMLVSTARAELFSGLFSRRWRDKVGANMGVPMLYEIDLDGCSFAVGAPDEFRRRQNNVLFSSDEFEYLGITARTKKIELVPFKPDFGKAFRQLALLNIDDADLYRRAWANVGGGGSEFITQYPMVGHARLRRAILRQLSTFDRGNPVVDRVATEVERLDITEEDLERPFGELVEEKGISAQCLGGLDTLLAMRLANKHIFDMTNQTRLTDSPSMLNLFTFIGMLEDVPAVFVAAEPFSGYISGFGKGVKILDDGGNILATGGYCPFSSYIQMDAQVEMFEVLRDVTDNATATAMFSAIEEEIEKRNLHADVERSRVERIADELLLALRIRLKTRAKKTMVRSSKGGLSYHVLKLGASEAEEITSVVGKLGAACPRVGDILTRDVKIIRKATGDLYNLRAVAEGIQTMAEYDGSDGAITIFHYPDRPHLLMTSVERQMFRDHLAHECFHPIWQALPRRAQERYKAISWGRRIRKKDLAEHFMTRYSRSATVSGASEEEDFCEHGAMYLNHPDEFRELAERCPPLREKYEFFRELFTFTDAGRGKTTVEFAEPAIVSVRDIDRDIETTLAKLDVEEAYKEMERRAELAFAAVQGKLGIKSIDEIVTEEEAEERKHTDIHEDDEDDRDEYGPEDTARAATYAGAMGDYAAEDATLVMRGAAAALLEADVNRTVVERAESEDLAELAAAYGQYLDDNDEDALAETLDEVVVRRLGNDEGVDAEAFAAAMRERAESQEEDEEEEALTRAEVVATVARIFANVGLDETITIKRDESDPRSFSVDIGEDWRPTDEDALAREIYIFNDELREQAITALEVRTVGVMPECYERLFSAIDGLDRQATDDLFGGGELDLGEGVRAAVEGGTIIVSRITSSEGAPSGFQGGGAGASFQKQWAAEANQGNGESLNKLVLEIERMILPQDTETLDAILEDLNQAPLAQADANAAYEDDIRDAVAFLEDEMTQDRTKSYTIGLNKAGTTKGQRKNIRRLVRTMRKKTGIRITFERELIDDPEKPTFTFSCRDGSGGLVGQTPIYLRTHSNEDLHLDRSLGILTLGLAAATVPENLRDSQRTAYAPIINVINRQHARLHITERGLIPDAASAEEIVDILHRKAIHLILPPVRREDFRKFEEFDMQQRMLDISA